MTYVARQPAIHAKPQISATDANSMAIVGAQTLIAAPATRIPLVLAR
jgi:hypothetical protein